MNEEGSLPGGHVVSTVMANLGLDRFLQQNGMTMSRTQVGDRYVLEQMLESGSSLGGEQSGHTIFSDWSTTGDGTLTALKVVEVIQRTGKPLSELASSFVRYPQCLINVPVRSKPELDTVPQISEAIQQKEEALENNGRILVRYSGTENKARVMVECEDEKLCSKHAQDVAQIIEREIGAV